MAAKRVHLTPEQKERVRKVILGFIEEIQGSELIQELRERAQDHIQNLQFYADRPSKVAFERAQRVKRSWESEERNWVTSEVLGHPELARPGMGQFSGYLTEKDAMTVLGVGRTTLRKVVDPSIYNNHIYNPFKLAEVKDHELVLKSRALIHRRNNPPRRSAWERIAAKKDPF